VDNLEEWQDCLDGYTDEGEQLEALRQGIIDDAWANIVEINISDGLDRYVYMERGKFNFKLPSAEIDSGRPKA
jgi:hypothetical protein